MKNIVFLRKLGQTLYQPLKGKLAYIQDRFFYQCSVTRKWWPSWHHHGCIQREENGTTVSGFAVATWLLRGPTLRGQGPGNLCVWWVGGGGRTGRRVESSIVTYYCATLSKFFMFLASVFSSPQWAELHLLHRAVVQW